MTFDLCRARTSMTFTHDAWKQLIELALHRNWQPAGTQPSTSRQQEHVANVPVASEAGAVMESNPLKEAIKAMLQQPDDPRLRGYFDNAGSRVSAKDARALADALEQALPDIPRHNALEHKCMVIDGERLLPEGVRVSPYERFSGSNRLHLEKFIAFCRNGGFRIW
jgi:hypothetical protein